VQQKGEGLPVHPNPVFLDLGHRPHLEWQAQPNLAMLGECPCREGWIRKDQVYHTGERLTSSGDGFTGDQI
jgi:hypothetical protein